MRKMLMVTTALMAIATVAQAQTITPGQGSITDAQGNVWIISTSGSIREGENWTPGGGGTSALTIINGTIYGQDNGRGPINPGGWFALSGDGQSWSESPAPASTSAAYAPVVPAPYTPVQVGQCQATTTASGGFRTVNGQIIGPDGKSFIARGVNLYEEQTGDANALIATFKGVNFIRVNIHSYKDPSTYSAFVQSMTSKGIVVEFEDHPDGGGGQDPAFTGSKLANELAWYTSMARAFAGNPYVWFGTFNEPGTQGDSVSQWEKQTYDSIRGTGNNNPILLEIVGWPGAWNNTMDPTDFMQMHNTIWDTHYYGWVSRYSTNQSTVDKALTDIIAQVQQMKSADGVMPALIGEYGDSTDGATTDPNGMQAVTAVVNLGGKGLVGSAAWHWNPGGSADHLMAGSQPTSPYGQTVQIYIGTDTVPLTPCQTTQRVTQELNDITAQVSAADAPTSQPPATGATPAVAATEDPEIAALGQSTDAAIAQANAIIGAAQQQMHAPLSVSQ